MAGNQSTCPTEKSLLKVRKIQKRILRQSNRIIRRMDRLERQVGRALTRIAELSEEHDEREDEWELAYQAIHTQLLATQQRQERLYQIILGGPARSDRNEGVGLSDIHPVMESVNGPAVRSRNSQGRAAEIPTLDRWQPSP